MRVSRARGLAARPAAAVVVWAVLVAVSVAWGRELFPGGRLNVAAPPFQAHYRWAPESIGPATVFAAVAVVVVPRLAATLRWRRLLAVGWLLGASWAVLLAWWDGHASIGQPIARRQEYLAVLPTVGDDPVGFVRGFAEHIHDYSVHVKGHPPGMVIVFWVWDRLGFSGGTWAAALVIAAGSSVVAAVAITLREVAGERTARDLLPFLVLAPYAVTVATSADAFFAGVAAWSAAAVTIGVRRGAPGWLLLGGLLAGALPYLNYGLLPFGILPLAAGWLAWARRSPARRPAALPWSVAAVGAGLLAVPLLMTVAGFWWPDGVAATHAEWVFGKGDDRPYWYSFVADLAILAVLVGPATAAGLASRSSRPVRVVVGAALVGVLALDLSGVTRLEVERIWLPFAPWVLVACAALTSRRRLWMALNASCALGFILLVSDVW